jgi:ketosteroid isomerase-like protein
VTVRETIDAYFDALTADDAAKLLSLISEDDHFIKIGTDAGEIVRGGQNARDYYQHHIESTADFSIDTRRLDIQERDTVAWFCAEQTWHLKWQGKPETLDMRITGVLEFEATVWRFEQIHASIGDITHSS